jgi:tetratricopeptide (TPR) repeat protein
LEGGATTSVAQSDVLSVLEQLINKSLIIKEETGGASRYRMLETIKQYANEKLIDANENDGIRDRHLEYFLLLAATAAPHLIRAEQLEWLAQLDVESPNIRAAFDWALGKESPLVSLHLCEVLGAFWSIRGHWVEGSKWLSRTFALCTKIENDAEKMAYVKARYWDANLAYAYDDLGRAGLSAEMSLTLAQECADKRDLAIARFMVSLVHYQKEKHKIARPLVEQSLKDFQELQDSYWEALCCDILGRVLTNPGELKPSQRILRKLEAARIAGERNQLADALFIVSIWHYTYNRIEEAKICAEEADMLWGQIGMQINSASMTFALIAWSNGDYERAISYYEDLRDFFGWQGAKHMRSMTISCLGNLALEQGDLVKAQMCLEQALATVREIDYKSAIAPQLVELGNIYFLQGDIAKFKEMVVESISLKNILNEYAKSSLLIDLLDTKAIQTHKIYISMLGALWAFETKNERPLRIMHKAFLTDQAISAARDKFDSVDFESIFTEGKNMSLDTALDLALKAVTELEDS